MAGWLDITMSTPLLETKLYSQRTRRGTLDDLGTARPEAPKVAWLSLDPADNDP